MTAKDEFMSLEDLEREEALKLEDEAERKWQQYLARQLAKVPPISRRIQ